jgi:16S rRNA C967 or C1407 C5-methylase (RsmB/RsmF family)
MEALKNRYEQDQLQEELRRIEEKEIEMARELSKKTKKETVHPYWFADLLSQGFKEQEILFAIEINGYDPDRVQNFLLDSM